MEITFEDKRYPLKNLSSRSGKIFGSLESRIAYTFSGKSAIALALNYYRRCQKLEDKNSQIITPLWLGTWVYMTMHNYCFPTTVVNTSARGIMVYHQWGFPQKMEKILDFARRRNLFVLEDCAHSFNSLYQGKRVGTFGDASIWSFSKFFPSVAGGAVYSKNTTLLNFVRNSYKKSDAALEKKVFTHLIHTNRHPTKAALREVARNYAVYPELFSCPTYATSAIAKELASGALERRMENFLLLRKAFWGKTEERLIENSNVCPWVVPLFFGSKNKKVAASLLKRGIESGVYHFDVNRNMLKPHFVECVAVPCHQGVTSVVMNSIMEIIQAAL